MLKVYVVGSFEVPSKLREEFKNTISVVDTAKEADVYIIVVDNSLKVPGFNPDAIIPDEARFHTERAIFCPFYFPLMIAWKIKDISAMFLNNGGAVAINMEDLIDWLDCMMDVADEDADDNDEF